MTNTRDTSEKNLRARLLAEGSLLSGPYEAAAQALKTKSASPPTQPPLPVRSSSAVEIRTVRRPSKTDQTPRHRVSSSSLHVATIGTVTATARASKISAPSGRDSSRLRVVVVSSSLPSQDPGGDIDSEWLYITEPPSDKNSVTRDPTLGDGMQGSSKQAASQQSHSLAPSEVKSHAIAQQARSVSKARVHFHPLTRKHDGPIPLTETGTDASTPSLQEMPGIQAGDRPTHLTSRNESGQRSTAKLDGVRLSWDNGSRSAAMLGGRSRRRRRMAGDSGKLDEVR
ncbi:hypothetical protein TREMEDRAFT_60409 [Tremella mesenterica DSM 1558]|uniref:uncharacterized protein n=1 Tax=Tremella mesenterica (strain ATCC 24925 / CBS 8224 / DSM 1558 / NBRC 9311 / NRRL Y-6157 / RJB 2259-6 / UBC 559-6) TaxID=578456 RepID=UPI0003F4921F|nr:uncharacterized protein TREMEDRAFT_60409 [Tremella mesenterica DSM 1558]EIW71483.1 hypothetical protein TREMEDRAFT_60409 [Tremella mesenterica DSM 1558]